MEAQMLHNKLFEDLKKELEHNRDIEDIVVFGSVARTNFRQYDDIDILVVYKDTTNLPEKPDYLRTLGIIYGVGIDPLFIKQGFRSEFNYLPFSTSRSRESFSGGQQFEFPEYHVFYCKNSEMNPQHPSIKNKNIFKEAISIKDIY